MEYYAVSRSNESLQHFGVKGMRWGIRRYQNPNGTLTEEGMRRYGRNASSIQRGLNKLERSKAEFRRDERTYGASKTEKRIGGTDKAIDQLIKEAEKKKYSISNKEVMRITDRGEGLVGFLLFMGPGALIGHYGFGKKIAGKKYKVREK